MRMRVLITVKTYPTLSTKYDELVCTAGFTEEGKWVRLYPIPFRRLDYDKRYARYQWIELDVERNSSDFRPETYRPVNYEKIVVGPKVEADGRAWAERRRLVLKKVHTNLDQLIAEAKDRTICTSLAVFKPGRIIDFTYKQVDREWDPKKLAGLKQLDIFRDSENPFEVVRKLPYKFSYVFEDDSNRETTMMIEDWETGQLFWNCLARHEGDEAKACEDVRKKYFDDFALTKDLFFYLGTTKEFHYVAPNPFIIVGTFHPKPESQISLL
jgi:hypothetical protein